MHYLICFSHLPCEVGRIGFRFSSTLSVSGISISTIDFIPWMACANSQGICGFSSFTAEESGSGEVMTKVGPSLGSVRQVSRGPPFTPGSDSG